MLYAVCKNHIFPITYIFFTCLVFFRYEYELRYNAPPDNDDDLDTDYENDQDLHHSLVGHKIKTIYDNG